MSKVEIDDGNEVQTIEIDSEKPFAFILPANAGNVTIYDINGNIVESVQHKIWILYYGAYVTSFIKCLVLVYLFLISDGWDNWQRFNCRI